jgi:cytochrome c556
LPIIPERIPHHKAGTAVALPAAMLKHCTAILLTALLTLTLAVSLAAQRPPKSVASTRDVMKAMTIPLSDAVFEAAGEAPKDDAGWEAVREKSAALAEAGNLLMTGSRVRDQKEWMGFAQAQVDAAEAVMIAAKAKNADDLSKAGDALYETCTACHGKYMSK